MADKVLVANRGEIAIRIMRACRELGLPSVAVYSTADENALFAMYADEAYPLGAAPATQSYLNIERIIEVAKDCSASAIHPGYGFLAENPQLPAACKREGIRFIGPSSEVIQLMGDKVAARREMRKAGVPVVPGTDECVSSFDEAKAVAGEIGYPVLVKPSGGGGGIGLITANDEAALQGALESSQRVARSAFGLPAVYIERYIPHARHIEVQVLGDSHGNLIHLGERECSIQRRNQKLIEESPSPALSPEMRREMTDTAVKAARWVNYEGAGTVEFIFSAGKFYFLEANTRIQVEHAVTEMVTGIDIVKEQIKIGLGLPLGTKQDDVKVNGWAIECRINAEDPGNNFAPAPGKLRGYRSPGGIGVRVDSGVHDGYEIPALYDSMISKLIVWGRTREEAIIRMRRALYEYIIVGVKTNIPFHKAVMENPRFVKGELETRFIDLETDLLDDMKRIAERERPLVEKLSQVFDRRRKAAVASALAVATQMLQKSSDEKRRP
jgi:pyruvate carboxylase subunit A